MQDTNANGIPDMADRLIGLGLAIASIVLGVLSQALNPCPAWVPIALASIGSVAALFTVGIIPRPVRGGTAALLVLLGMATAAGGCKPTLVNGYRGYGLAVIAGKSADKVIVGTCKAKLYSCQGAHRKAVDAAQGVYTQCKLKETDPRAMLACKIPLAHAQVAALEAYRKCKAGCTSAVKLWVEKIAPGYNAGLAVYWGSLETARIAGSKEYTIPQKAMPGLCALIKAPAFFRHLFGKSLEAIMKPMLAVKGLVCHE